MPTYEYECTKCGHTFEAIQSIMDKPLSRCPNCKGAVRRVINGGMGVIFKGSGFYTTDNKRGSALTGGNGSSRGQGKVLREAEGDQLGTKKSSAKPVGKGPRRKKRPLPEPCSSERHDIGRVQCFPEQALHGQARIGPLHLRHLGMDERVLGRKERSSPHREGWTSRTCRSSPRWR